MGVLGFILGPLGIILLWVGARRLFRDEPGWEWCLPLGGLLTLAGVLLVEFTA